MTLWRAHAGNDMVAVMNSVLKSGPADPSRLAHKAQDKVPIEIGRVILRAMARDPKARFQTVTELRSALRDILDGEILPICACTTVKFSFHEIVRKIDNYPILAAFVLLWMIYPLLHLGYLGWEWFHP